MVLAFFKKHLIFKIAKICCAIMVSIIIAILFIIPKFNSAKKQLEFDLSPRTVKSQEFKALPKMTNPRFSGVTANSEPYDLFAESALQLDKEHIQLSLPNGILKTKENKDIYILSETGLILQNEKNLQLIGDVNLYYDLDMHALTNSAVIMLNDAIIKGEDPIEIYSIKGHLYADSFIFYRKENKLNFDGHVKVTLHPKGN